MIVLLRKIVLFYIYVLFHNGETETVSYYIPTLSVFPFLSSELLRLTMVS